MNRIVKALPRRYTGMFICVILGFYLPLNAQSKYTRVIRLDQVERRGVYDIMKLYIDEICIKEIPFFIALHRCFYQDKRLPRGYQLLLNKNTIMALKKNAISLHNIGELEKSLIHNIKNIVFYKKKKNRFKKSLCNFIIDIEPGAYKIPKTGGAKFVVPGKIMGSIYYNRKNRTNKMTVYLHTGGIKLELPKYAKRISLGILSDMDIGIAELEFIRMNWITRLVYVKSKDNPQRKGWSLNTTECNKIRPYSSK